MLRSIPFSTVLIAALFISGCATSAEGVDGPIGSLEARNNSLKGKKVLKTGSASIYQRVDKNTKVSYAVSVNDDDASDDGICNYMPYSIFQNKTIAAAALRGEEIYVALAEETESDPEYNLYLGEDNFTVFSDGWIRVCASYNQDQAVYNIAQAIYAY